MSGIRDEGLLDSALAQPRQTFNGHDLYALPEEKAGRYAFGIIRNHPFIDGNKRTGAACIGICLRINGFRFKPRHDDFQQTIIAVADGNMGFEQLVSWIQSNL